MGGRYVRTVIYREQLIFLVISRCRRLKSLSNLFIVSDIRAGEITALYWEDIDLDTGMLFVWLTLVKVGAEYIRQEPKMADNTRRLVMAFTLAACLKHSDFAEKPQRGKWHRGKASRCRLFFQIFIWANSGRVLAWLDI